uniref:Putative secreted protein n=1 Tax=Anopheles darlingi TaxID=43151 RepID=A0A2M4DBB1_ANODA
MDHQFSKLHRILRMYSLSLYCILSRSSTVTLNNMWEGEQTGSVLAAPVWSQHSYHPSYATGTPSRCVPGYVTGALAPSTPSEYRPYTQCGCFS